MKYLLVFIFSMNLITFMTFGLDKRKAVKNRWRIPEKTLLLMGRCFGSIGQLAGMKVFRHKIHKWYFWGRGIASAILQVVILYYVITNCIG